MKKRKKRERKKQDRGIVDFVMVANHFLHSLKDWILEMEDPRNQSYFQQRNLYRYVSYHVRKQPA